LFCLFDLHKCKYESQSSIAAPHFSHGRHGSNRRELTQNTSGHRVHNGVSSQGWLDQKGIFLGEIGTDPSNSGGQAIPSVSLLTEQDQGALWQKIGSLGSNSVDRSLGSIDDLQICVKNAYLCPSGRPGDKPD
jgi:hypothetical protein